MFQPRDSDVNDHIRWDVRDGKEPGFDNGSLRLSCVAAAQEDGYSRLVLLC